MVALKTLRDGNVEALFRLKREFRALADIAHPNLVALHELLAHEDQWFFTMELVEGVNFLQYVRGRARRCSGAAPDALRPPAGAPPATMPGADGGLAPRRAVRTASARRCGRRSPGSRPCTGPASFTATSSPPTSWSPREGRLVLLDFGLVTDLADRARSGAISIVGTPAYMSPEQGSARPLSEATDWYSLGVMLFEALTGRWPFTGSFIEMMWDKRHTDAPAPRDLAPGHARGPQCPLPRPAPPGSGGAAAPEKILARLGARAGGDLPGASARPPPPARTPPFVGTARRTWPRCDRAFEAARAGRAVVVRLHGPSGAGKTALARRFLQERAAVGSRRRWRDAATSANRSPTRPSTASSTP